MLAKEKKWQIFVNSWKKTQFLMNTRYVDAYTITEKANRSITNGNMLQNYKVRDQVYYRDATHQKSLFFILNVPSIINLLLEITFELHFLRSFLLCWPIYCSRECIANGLQLCIKMTKRLPLLYILQTVVYPWKEHRKRWFMQSVFY